MRIKDKIAKLFTKTPYPCQQGKSEITSEEIVNFSQQAYETNPNSAANNHVLFPDKSFIDLIQMGMQKVATLVEEQPTITADNTTQPASIEPVKLFNVNELEVLQEQFKQSPNSYNAYQQNVTGYFSPSATSDLTKHTISVESMQGIFEDEFSK